MDKLKNNLASIAALIAAVIAIGGGFAKFGELDALSSAKGVDISGLEITVQGLEKDIAIIQTENKLFKAMIQEMKLQSGNPLSQ